MKMYVFHLDFCLFQILGVIQRVSLPKTLIYGKKWENSRLKISSIHISHSNIRYHNKKTKIETPHIYMPDVGNMDIWRHNLLDVNT